MPVQLATASDSSAAVFTFGSGSSGGTVYFRLLLVAPEQSRELQVSVRHIPGGNTNFVDIGGDMPAYIRGRAMFATYADFLTMRDSALGVLATLQYTEATYSVYLTKIRRQDARGVNTTGYQLADVEFLINS